MDHTLDKVESERQSFVYYNLSFFETYETFPVEIVRAQAREHLTHARARCASNDRRAHETREQIEARARETREQIEARAREVREQGQDVRVCSRAHPSDTRARK